MRPVWSWLRGDSLPDELERVFWVPAGLRRIGGTEAVTSMRAFRAGVPWPSVVHSWPLLDSHDTPRFGTVAGSRERQVVGIGLQMTTPGVPMVFAGDEVGLEGDWGEDARRTIPWDRPESWDTSLLEEYRRLIALRRSSDALARGGSATPPPARMRSRTCARAATSACCASRAGPRTRRSRCRSPRSRARRSSRSTAARRPPRRRRDTAVRRPVVPRLETHVIREGVARRG